jgi:hypothetical protein
MIMAEIATITFRLPKAEKGIIETYCSATGRNQTDVLREFIRSLESRPERAGLESH